MIWDSDMGIRSFVTDWQGEALDVAPAFILGPQDKPLVEQLWQGNAGSI
jgi:hypothetical protein